MCAICCRAGGRNGVLHPDNRVARLSSPIFHLSQGIYAASVSFEGYVECVRSFHNCAAPGILVGALMVDLARWR